MNNQIYEAFLDELAEMEKDAFLRGAASWAGQKALSGLGSLGRGMKSMPGELVEAGKRMLTPWKSIPAGWRKMTPSAQIAHAMKTAPNRAAAEKMVEETMRGAGRHITHGAQSSHLPGRIAESLSRRGWTGKGNVTKYIPLASQKGMTVGFGGLSAKAVLDAAKKKPTQTGEGGVAETGLGELLGTGAFIAGTGGLGMIPATAMYMAGQGAGSRAGRIIDRLRGGASLRTAALAPSPREANQMLSDLENQSPEEQKQTVDTLRRYYG